MARKAKTIYLNNARRRRKFQNKKMVVGVVVGLSLLVGVGVALLPNAYRITVDGEVIGEVAKREYIDEALKTLEVKLEKQYKTEVKMEEVNDIKKVRVAKKDLMDPNKLESALREHLDIELEFQELYVDGEKVAIIESKEALDELKTNLKKKYYDDTSIRADFANEVKLKSIFATEEDLTPMDELVDICTKRQKKIVTYEVQPGDTLSGIAKKLGTTITDILKANEGMTDKTPLKIGQVLSAEVRTPLLGLEIIELPTTQETGDQGAEKQEANG